jgi:kynurenine formamidase
MSRMKTTSLLFACTLVLAFLLFAQRHKPAPEQPLFSHIIDLTHTISSRAPTFDDSEKFTARTVETIEKDGYFAREITLPEHFATHVDAPAHFTRGMWTVEQIPPERLVAPLVVIDIRSQVQNDPDYMLRVEDIAAWEQAHGSIPFSAVVMARTGWDRHWDSPREYRNADGKGVRHFPGYSLDAARFLVEGRYAVGLGIDTLSIDPGTSADFPVHHYTSVHEVYHLEAVTHLELAPATGAMVVVAPAKLQGGSGGPVRVLALVK